MGVAADESALLESALELSAAVGEFPVLVTAGKEAGSGAGGSCVGLFSWPFLDSTEDVVVPDPERTAIVEDFVVLASDSEARAGAEVTGSTFGRLVGASVKLTCLIAGGFTGAGLEFVGATIGRFPGPEVRLIGVIVGAFP